MNKKKKAVIVGATGNIGLALQKELKSLGYEIDKVWASKNHPDVTDRKAFNNLPGSIDLAVYLAGLNAVGPTQVLSDKDWDRVVDVNLSGAFRFARASYPGLKKAKGTLILISSITATHPYPGRAVYASSKAGLEGLSSELAIEWGKDGIHTHAIRLGHLNAFMKTTKTNPRLLEEVAKHTPDGKLIEPEEIAKFIAWIGEHGRALGSIVTFDPAYTINRWPIAEK